MGGNAANLDSLYPRSHIIQSPTTISSTMAAQQDPPGPSEIVLKLVLPCLGWRQTIKSELVCKRWKSAAVSDDVFRPLCDRELKLCKRRLSNWKAQRPDAADKEYDSFAHEILVVQMEKKIASGRSTGIYSF